MTNKEPIKDYETWTDLRRNESTAGRSHEDDQLLSLVSKERNAIRLEFAAAALRELRLLQYHPDESEQESTQNLEVLNKPEDEAERNLWKSIQDKTVKPEYAAAVLRRLLLDKQTVYPNTLNEMANDWNQAASEKANRKHGGNINLGDRYWIPVNEFYVCRYGKENPTTHSHSFAYLPEYCKTENYTPEAWQRLLEAYDVPYSKLPPTNYHMKIVQVATSTPDFERLTYPSPGKTRRGRILLSEKPFPLEDRTEA